MTEPFVLAVLTYHSIAHQTTTAVRPLTVTRSGSPSTWPPSNGKT